MARAGLIHQDRTRLKEILERAKKDWRDLNKAVRQIKKVCVLDVSFVCSDLDKLEKS